jgi:hypothetical protein
MRITFLTSGAKYCVVWRFVSFEWQEEEMDIESQLGDGIETNTKIILFTSFTAVTVVDSVLCSVNCD